MPTPFQHLTCAQALLDGGQLPAELAGCLRDHAGAFCLGNTAGDVQTVTGQPRVETHFYHLRDLRDAAFDAGGAMLAAYPQLTDPARLTPAHAAFLSGYLMHLAWDEVWAREVFLPHYFDSPRWAEHLPRSMHHNALRVLLDRQAEARLRAGPDVAACLRAARPQGWLPFAPDAAVGRWRDWLVGQLTDPASVQTAQVFAERMGVSPERLEGVVRAVRTEAGSSTEHPLREALARFERRAAAHSRRALLRYWGYAATLEPDGATALTAAVIAEEASVISQLI